MFNLKYRPSTFDEFIGNEYIIRGLLASYPKWPSTFLLVGPPGVGKTTLGRLIAKQLQCPNINIKEIDAGQDRGIDKIRQVINEAYNRPLVGKIKVYIFDECQGLTKEAQQALLKVTEEAPGNTYFIFCSTDPQKIIKALQERCQNGFIALQPLTNFELGVILKNIAEKEGIKIENTVKDIAKLCILNAEGIPRRALMLFEKFYRYEKVEQVSKELENVDEYIPDDILELMKALESKDYCKFLKIFADRKEKQYESLRITLGNIFKKKLLYAMINRTPTSGDAKIIDYQNILSMFVQPVDNQIGDIELIYRFSVTLSKSLYALR